MSEAPARNPVTKRDHTYRLKKVTKSNKPADFVAKALPALAEAVKVAGPTLKEMNEQARAQHNHLRAMLTQFKIDIEQGISSHVLRTQK